MHTPGTWQAVEWNCHARTTIVSEVDGARVVVAECGGHGRYADDSIDDARLLAAAKELLAAAHCEEALRQGSGAGWEALRAYGWAGTVDGERDSEFVARVRKSALAKAEGRLSL